MVNKHPTTGKRQVFFPQSIEYTVDGNEPETPEYKLIPHRDFYLISGIHCPEEVDEIQNWEIRDSDVFIVTYPKSGTIWMQQIMSLIEAKGDVTATMNQLNSDRIPWIELIGSKDDSAPSPRIRVTHLHHKFTPLGLKQKKGKDLRSVVDQICVFLERDLTAQQKADVVEHSTFRNMRRNPSANYQNVSTSLLDHSKGTFMRKGTIGDWKNYFTVAQNERFDRVFKEKMRDFPLTFVWDISDIMK
ncbi:amine sulfotransferase-like isoform X3 [Anguilla rostrata]|uniref:amine sulfotransferase-like isoform X3 n=1 Tax=Anguilla rostrata TaxID=7938 RepID=UPI0030D1BEC0